MLKIPNIFVINTGSTSTKIAIFKGEELFWEQKIDHSVEELEQYSDFEAQVNHRKKIILRYLNENHFSVKSFDLIMCRGGLIKPVESGIYKVNLKMLNDLKNSNRKHASNLSAVIGYSLSENKNNVFIADPVVVDEMQDIARYSGHKLFKRVSIFHALNHKAVARKFSDNQQMKYENLNLIVVHMGGGISVAAHHKGKVIDVNQALDGEGPFSPERSGTLPAGDLVDISFSEKYTYDEVKKMIVGKGGLVSYLGSNNVQEIEKNLNKNSEKILKAMSYQIAKSIGEMAVVLYGKVDAIILTGGIAYSKFITENIKKYVQFIAPVYIYPGEDEMQALAYNGLLLWNKNLKDKDYL